MKKQKQKIKQQPSKNRMNQNWHRAKKRSVLFYRIGCRNK